MKSLLVPVSAAALAMFARAQEFGADAGETPAAESGAAAGAQNGETAGAPADEGKSVFSILPYCRELRGRAEVLEPGGQWEPVEEGRYYPLGSSYRTLDAKTFMRINFGTDCDVIVKNCEAAFGTRAQKLSEKSRTVHLVSGTITVSLPNNLKEGLFSVVAPGFEAYNPAGESRYTYKPAASGDGYDATIRCVTKTLSVRGRHFNIDGMRAANEFRIRTSRDLLFTGLYGLSGDIPLRLDQGSVLVKDFGTGESHVEDKYLDWKLSPKTKVAIHRAVPAVGEKLSVAVMTFDSSGELKNRCAFTEKTFEVNSGELGPTSKKDREALVKRAADVADSAAAADAAAAVQETEATEETPAPAPAADGGGF